MRQGGGYIGRQARAIQGHPIGTAQIGDSVIARPRIEGYRSMAAGNLLVGELHLAIFTPEGDPALTEADDLTVLRRIG